jgi:aconitase A
MDGFPQERQRPDLVLTVTQQLRQKKVVGKFVEFLRRRAFVTVTR